MRTLCRSTPPLHPAAEAGRFPPARKRDSRSLNQSTEDHSISKYSAPATDVPRKYGLPKPRAMIPRFFSRPPGWGKFRQCPSSWRHAPIVVEAEPHRPFLGPSLKLMERSMSLLSRNRASISVTSVGHVNILAPPNKAVQFPPKAVCASAFSPFHFENDITYCP